MWGGKFRLGQIFQWRDAARPRSDDVIFRQRGVSRGGAHDDGVRMASGGWKRWRVDSTHRLRVGIRVPESLIILPSLARIGDPTFEFTLRASVHTQSPKVEMIDSLYKRVSDPEDERIVRELQLDFYTSSRKMI